ncbi:MAG: hypothetical protein IJA18_00435 [Ruminococcus sp.]|nr:hypothetical protein [Ruminococcus sp.]
MRTDSRSKLNIPLQLAAVLLCLTLISVYLVSGLYARYATTQRISKAAAVAEFSPLASFTEDTWVFDSDASQTAYSFEYEIKLSNPSEVDVNCGLEITFPDDMLSGAVFTFNDTVKENNNGTAINFGNFEDLSSGDATGVTKILKITINKECYDRIMSTHNGQNNSLSAYFDAVISFTQID